MSFRPNAVRIECPSHHGMLDVIQIHSDHIGRLGSFDDVDVKRVSSAGMGLGLVKKFGSPE